MKLMKTLREKWERMKASAAVETETHDAHGKFKPDPNPKEWPVGLRRPPTLNEQIAMAMRGAELQRRMAERGEETLRESMDWGEDDDQAEAPLTPHNHVALKEDVLREGAIETDRQAARSRRKTPEKKADETAPRRPQEPLQRDGLDKEEQPSKGEHKPAKQG